MTERKINHATFTIERTFDAKPARVFSAFSDPEAKRRWFVDGEGWTVESFDAAFSVGGHERSAFRFHGGPLIRNDTTYFDIVQNQRIVIAYAMQMEETPLSVSLLTMEFKPEGAGTRFVLTEQGAYLDGHDDGSGRKKGTEGLMDALAAELKR